MEAAGWIALGLLIFFLIGRELVCWYFKIPKALELLAGIKQELTWSREILQRTEQRDIASRPAAAPVVEAQKVA